MYRAGNAIKILDVEYKIGESIPKEVTDQVKQDVLDAWVAKGNLKLISDMPVITEDDLIQ